jgi:5-methylcytosine-specific restriction endonuclease McrA
MNNKGNPIRHSRIQGRAGIEQRKRIRLRDGYKCRHCSTVIRVGEVDHIKPLEHGGSNDDSNLQLLCYPCHNLKTALDRGYVLKSGSTEDGLPTSSHHHWNR